MRKKVISILSGVFLVLLIIVLTYFKLTAKSYEVKSNNSNINWNLIQQGIKDSVDFTFDDENNIYIAFQDKILKISSKGESKVVIEDGSYKIQSIELYNNLIYFVSNNKIYTYNLESEVCEEILNSLPIIGDYSSKIIKINKDKIYISIGAVTNSGVVGPDNTWLKDYPEGKDITPFMITLKGINFGSEKSGAFVPYKVKTSAGEKIPSNEIGTSTIASYDIKKKKIETYAYGIRNITGMDFDSNNNLIAAVGGMENRGLRPVKGDSDYIYMIQKNNWYGFPDYSGGDQIDSPRFTSGNNTKLTAVLQKHPDINPPAPVYVNKNLSAISALAVDKEGIFGKVNNIYFIDKTDKVLYSLSTNGMLKNEVNFMDSISINSIKFINKKLYVLDSDSGNLLSFYKNEKYIGFYDTKIIYGMIGIIFIAIGVLSKVLYDGAKKKNHKKS